MSYTHRTERPPNLAQPEGLFERENAMRRGAIVFTLAMAAISGRAQTPAGATAFTNALVLAGEMRFERATLVVRDGRIESLGPAASVRPPAGARVVDLGGK